MKLLLSCLFSLMLIGCGGNAVVHGDGDATGGPVEVEVNSDPEIKVSGL